MTPVVVKAGQVFKGSSPQWSNHRARYIKIVQVRRQGPHEVYALAHEVARTGRRKGAADYPIRIFLTFDGRAWTLPPWYSEAER
jgi:hypothetical protein